MKKINFKLEIGQRIKDKKRDITITDRKYKSNQRKNGYIENKKYYKYKCNKCGFDSGRHYSVLNEEYREELWIEENNLGIQGCSCCANKVVVENINSIVKTDPWMIPYFQGGYDEAKLYTKTSNKKIYPLCPCCNKLKDKNIPISSIYKNHSIDCYCSDKQPYTEKFMSLVLHKLKVEFKTQLSKTTFEWVGKYRYDFYFEYDNEQYIVETHGEQHYIQTNRKGARTLEEEKLNDKIKKELALSNGIKPENYIVIDCRKSELEWIKYNNNGIFKSKLNELFNLNKIDWTEVEEFTCSNLVKIVSKIKKENPNITILSISNKVGFGIDTVRKWLKIGNELGWCYYNAKEDLKKSASKNGKKLSKKVGIFKDGILLDIFNSINDLVKNSEKIFKTRLHQSSISNVCLGNIEEYKGYVFKYM